MIINGLISGLLFLVSLWLIFSEKLNRTIAAFLGAALMLGLGKLLGFYSEVEALSSIDFNTLGLLLGMMILVALLEPTGLFEYLAVWASRLSRGNPVRLLVLLGTITTVLSMFLDNVTTVVLVAPVTILMGEILGINPMPFLMAEALLSNTGGVATLVGDPPNVLIASAAGFSFVDFLTHSFPIVLVVWLAALLLLRYLFRKELSVQPSNPEALQGLDLSETLTDRVTAFRVLVVLACALLGFLLHGLLEMSPAFIALSAAAGALIWVQPNPSEVLKRVEWSVLAFFAALFVMVGGLEATGVLDALARLAKAAVSATPVLSGVALIWLVAGISAMVDNVPVTIALIPVIEGLASGGVNVNPFWWALVFGAGFGGNGTIVGSTANIVVAGLSERTRTPITSRQWNRRGLPVMLTTCAVASLLYVLFFPLFIR